MTKGRAFAEACSRPGCSRIRQSTLQNVANVSVHQTKALKPSSKLKEHARRARTQAETSQAAEVSSDAEEIASTSDPSSGSFSTGEAALHPTAPKLAAK